MNNMDANATSEAVDVNVNDNETEVHPQIQQQVDDKPFRCQKCGKRFKTNRGSLQHARQCKANAREAEPPPAEPPDAPPLNPEAPQDEVPQGQVPAERFYWGDVSGSEITNAINDCYEKTVFWRRNLFILPNGAAGKNYIREVTRLLNAWTENSPRCEISIKAIHIMPSLLLQKPSRDSNSQDHQKALERRLLLRHKGDICSLLNEAETLQRRLPMLNQRNDIMSISKRFQNQMEKGNVNGAMKGGILPLTEQTLE